MEIKGRIKEIFVTEQVNERFKKREFVLLTDENTEYPQEIIFKLFQKNVSQLDELKEGDTVTVLFSIKGKSNSTSDGKTKYYNTLEAWRIDKGR